MRSDICDLKHITLDYDNERMILNNCRNMIIFMKIKSDERIKRVIRAHYTIIVSFKLITFISIRLRKVVFLFKKCNLMFHSKVSSRFDDNENIFLYIIDANMCIVQMNNASNQSIVIFRNFRLDVVQNYEKKKCYVVHSKDVHLIASFDARNE